MNRVHGPRSCSFVLGQLVQIMKNMKQKGAADASEAMKGNLYSISTASDIITSGLEVTLVSMMMEGNLTFLLNKQKVQCTMVINR